jgi:Mlc titration factor MtfA (ptsG expression regulator)
MGLLQWRRRRRSGRDGRTMPEDWEAILLARFAQWRELDAAERARLHDLVVRFMRETRWEAARSRG